MSAGYFNSNRNEKSSIVFEYSTGNRSFKLKKYYISTKAKLEKKPLNYTSISQNAKTYNRAEECIFALSDIIYSYTPGKKRSRNLFGQQNNSQLKRFNMFSILLEQCQYSGISVKAKPGMSDSDLICPIYVEIYV